MQQSTSNSSSTHLTQEKPNNPVSHKERHQKIPTALSGTGTWTGSGTETKVDSLDTPMLTMCTCSQHDSQSECRSSSCKKMYSPGHSIGTLGSEIPRLIEPCRNSVANSLMTEDGNRDYYVHIEEPSNSLDHGVKTRTGPHAMRNTSCPIFCQFESSEFLSMQDDRSQDSHTNFAKPSATPIESNESSTEDTDDPYRPYTSRLGLPHHYPPDPSPGLSIISDAGEQQHLRQQRGLVVGADVSNTGYGFYESLQSLASQTSPFELQRNIYHALVPTQHSDTSMPEYEFLPNGELCRVLSTEAVMRQLMADLSQSHTSEQIQRYADSVCQEVEVMRKGKKMLKGFRKVFALLVMVEMTSSISHFLKEDVSDLDLPLVPLKANGMIELRRRDSAGEPSSKPLRCFKHTQWSIAKLRHFEKEQWILLAPFFAQGEHGEIKHYILRDQHILPFVASQDAADDDIEYLGGFGKVKLVRIHEEHHDFKETRLCKRGFAVKQLYENDPESFWKEVHILKKFSGARSHKHIVSLLATYEHRKKFHFIFYRAEADLFRLWREVQPLPALTYRNVLWVAEQCVGIAKGLLKLHKHSTIRIRHIDPEMEPLKPSNRDKHIQNIGPISHVRSDSMQTNGVQVRHMSPNRATSLSHAKRGGFSISGDLSQNVEYIPIEEYGRHGDINPSNILWYNDGPAERETLSGTLKIADFGQAELNSFRSKSKPRSVANTMTYRPPECDTQPRIIRQSYDIWCLGCVYLEFVTWILGGEQLLTKFGRDRKSPDIFHNNDETDTFFEFVPSPATATPEVQIKPVVLKFIDELYNHPNCTDYFHDLLVKVQNDMLVVESQTQGQSKDRKTCDQVQGELAELCKRCRKDKDYACKTTPWSNRFTRDPLQRSVKVDMTKEAEKKITEYLAHHLCDHSNTKKS